MIHPKALVDDPDSLGAQTNVWAFAHVMKGARVGAQCNIGDHAFIESGAIVGDRVTIKNGVLIWDGVTIADDVFVGPGVVFTNDRSPRSPRMPQVKARYSTRANWLAGTTVERGASLGAGVTICPGVTVGSYSMVGAGSLVTKNVEPFSLVYGSPATHRGYVCTCGNKLQGHFQVSDCELCGERGVDRQIPA